MSRFSSEAGLVEKFLQHLTGHQHPWGTPLSTATEFFYCRGRTDVVARSPNGEVVAFEAKLGRWKEALHQAYRNTCYANRSYVVVPEETADLASRSLREFRRREVGLCFVTDEKVVVVEEAPAIEPLQPLLTAEASDRVTVV